jgi:hypothetical protein
VMPHIAADNLRDLVRIDPRRVFCHRALPVFNPAVVVELVLRSAIIPAGCSLPNKILRSFHNVPYVVVSCSCDQSFEIPNYSLRLVQQPGSSRRR